MTVILGIDPGVNPTVCVLIDEVGKPLAAEFHFDEDTSYLTEIGGRRVRRPSAPLLRNIVADSLATLAIIEDVASMPGQGVASMFAFGYSSGLIEGVVAAMQVPILRVGPNVWKRAFRIPAKSDKAISRHIASTLAPSLAHEFAKTKDHNKADAFLMAYWGRTRAKA